MSSEILPFHSNDLRQIDSALCCNVRHYVNNTSGVPRRVSIPIVVDHVDNNDETFSLFSKASRVGPGGSFVNSNA